MSEIEISQGGGGTSSPGANWATPRLLAGNSVDGSANVPFANKFIVQGTVDSGLSNAQFLGALGTGILKNTTTTGVLSIAVAGDFPTLNQNTTGSAATLTTPRAINGVNFDGSAAITITAAAGTLTGNTLAAGVTASSLTSVGILTGLTVSSLTLGSVPYIGTGGLFLDDNANHFWDGTGHRLWIGAAGAPTNWPVAASKFNIYSASDADVTLFGDGINATLNMYAYGTGVQPAFFGHQARGTLAGGPTASQAGDILFRVSATGYGTSFPGAGKVRMDFLADETWDATHQGTATKFYSTLNGTTSPQSVWHQIDGAGNITLTTLGNGNVSVTSSGTGTITHTSGGAMTFTATGAITHTTGASSLMTMVGGTAIYHYPNGLTGGYVYFKNNTPTTGGTPGPVQMFENIIAITGNGWSPATNALFTVANYANPETFYGASDGAGHEGSIFTSGAEGCFTFPGGVITPVNPGGYGYFLFDSIAGKTALTIGYANPTSNVTIGGATGTYKLLVTGAIGQVGSVNTDGAYGVPAIIAAPSSTRFTAQVAAKQSASYAVTGGDASFIVSANVLVTASTTHSFTVTCTYTDEGSTSRTLTLSFSQTTGTFLTAITNVQGIGAYEGVPLHIRVKTGTSIVIASVGTFTSVTYNIESAIQKLSL